MKVKNCTTLDWVARLRNAQENSEKLPTLEKPKYSLREIPFLFELDREQAETLSIVLKTINKLKQ